MSGGKGDAMTGGGDQLRPVQAGRRLVSMVHALPPTDSLSSAPLPPAPVQHWYVQSEHSTVQLRAAGGGEVGENAPLVEVVADEAPDEGDAAGEPVLVGVGDAAGGLAVVDTAARVGLGEVAVAWVGLGEVAVAWVGTGDSDGTITTTGSGECEASGDDDARSGLAEAWLTAGDRLGEAGAGVAVAMGVGETATATLGDAARLGLAAALAGVLELDELGARVVDGMATTGDGDGAAGEEVACPADGVGEDAAAAPDEGEAAVDGAAGEEVACPADGVGEDAAAAPDEGEAAVDGSVAMDGRGATLVTVASCLGAHRASLYGVECVSRQQIIINGCCGWPKCGGSAGVREGQRDGHEEQEHQESGGAGLERHVGAVVWFVGGGVVRCGASDRWVEAGCDE
jgi:hypothetical protein